MATDYGNFNPYTPSEVQRLIADVIHDFLNFNPYTLHGEQQVKLETYGSTTYTNDAPRGEIYDRNYTKIMGNQNVICVDYYAPKKITDKEITYIAKFLSEKITIDFSKNNVNNITERNIKDYFIIAHEKIAESLLSD